MRIRIVASAAKDLDEGYDFYESKEPGAGDYFVSTLKAEIFGRNTCNKIQGLPSNAFTCLPFAVYYRKTIDEVIVQAVVDCRRHPAWIRQHLDT